jgi:hypothetical protein
MQSIENGTYVGRVTDITVYEATSGNLVAAVICAIVDGPELRHYATIAKADGTLNTKVIDNVKAWSGWDGADPFWLIDNRETIGQKDLELVVENRPDVKDPSKTFPSIQWINKPGESSGGASLPAAADRRAILSKYGSKLRANAGGTTHKPAAPQPPSTPAPSAPPSRPPSRPPTPAAVAATAATRKPADLNSCWDQFEKQNANLSQTDREKAWFDLVDRIGENKGQDKMTPDDWEKVASVLDQIPF